MYLLIPYPKISAKLLRLLFTFHNVSINSSAATGKPIEFFNLHSIMYLLIPLSMCVCPYLKQNLHSIMYLLIHGVTRLEANSTAFTFHNVSINSNSNRFAPDCADKIYIP